MMDNFADVFRELNKLERDGVIQSYAIAGATAFLFYTEPVLTYNLDVFIFLPPQEGPFASMGPLYSEMEERGYTFDAEHIMMHGTPVQFLLAYNSLAMEAVDQAIVHDYDGVPVRVISPEHLVALALQTGGEHRRGRAKGLLAESSVNIEKLNAILGAHNISLNEAGETNV